MFQVVAEVHPNISTCNLYISISDHDFSYQSINISKSECTFQFNGGTELLVKLPRGVCLVPNSVKSVNQEGNRLTARLQLDERTSMISALTGDILNDSTCEDISPASILTDTQMQAQCKHCKFKILSTKFRRVLPLPSVDWDQASEGWFCHLHESDGQKLKPHALQPALDECLFTELYFLVNSDIVNCLEGDLSAENVLCPGCRKPVGSKERQSSMKLWTHSIIWVEECGSVLYKRDVSDIVLSLFRNIDRDNFGVNCRLVLQAQISPRQHLYMVTINTNQKLLLPEESSVFGNGTVCGKVENGSEFVKDNDESGNEFVKDNSESGNEFVKENGESTSPPKKLCMRENVVELKSVYVVKLMYELKEGEDNQTGSWVDDPYVHIIPCSAAMLNQVKSLLASSRSCLPDDIKVVDHLNVGFIVKNNSVMV